MFVTIAEVDSIAKARILVAALKGYGFSPMEGGETGLPGLPGVPGIKGLFEIRVPEGEAAGAKALAKALIADMAD